MSEVVGRRVRDIDAQRAMLRVEPGTGRKARSPLFGPRLLAEWRHYGQGDRPAPPWLFPQRHQAAPRDPPPAQKLSSAAKRRAGLPKAGGLPALRPAFVPPLLEAGTELPPLPQLLGHDRVTTTRRYVHLAPKRVAAHGSPLDGLAGDDKRVAYALPRRSSPAPAAGREATPPRPPFAGADLVGA